MLFDAKIYKSGKQWLAEIPALDAMTQGKSKADAKAMLKDWIRSALARPDFEVTVRELGKGAFAVIVDNSPHMVGFFLQRQRMKKGLSTRQVAELLGLSSHNAYAQYEQGRREASISSLNKFMAVLSPNRRLELKFE